MMNKKVFGLIFIVLKLTLLKGIIGESIDCHFEQNQRHGYTCEILSITPSSKSENCIEGTHETNKNNTYVKLVTRTKSPRINFTIFDSVFCRRFPNLEGILMDNLIPATVAQNALQNCKNLRNFSLTHAELHYIKENFFPSPSKLTKLNLGSNNLQTLPENSLKDQLELEVLILSENDIENLSENIFKSLTKLRVLSLDRNRIKKLKPAWLKKLNNLETLSLEGNIIRKLLNKVFEPLKNLRKLWLFDNKISKLSSNSFGNNSKLEVLSFFNNNIQAVDQKLIDKLLGIEELDLRENKCINEEINGKDELKLQKCFENYKEKKSTASKTKEKSISKEKTCECSEVSTGSMMGFGSQAVFPWSAKLKNPDGSQFCSGVLVSNSKILTAAHCVHSKGEDEPRSAQDFHVILGEPNKKSNFSVDSIEIHPDWNIYNDNYDADIAVLHLTKNFTSNAFIQPICLAKSESPAALIAKGFVGLNNGTSKVLEMTINENEECFKKKSTREDFSSDRTFCAASGRGICKEDIGGGLYVKENDIFHLRGIVTAAFLEFSFDCNPNPDTIFTKIWDFDEWINN